MKSPRFKVGDLVVALSSCPYAITNSSQRFPMKVIRVWNTNEEYSSDMSVNISTDGTNYSGDYDVCSKFFTLYKTTFINAKLNSGGNV